MTIDPRIPTKSGWRTSGFHRHEHQARNPAKSLARVARREGCILQKTTWEVDFGTLWVISCMQWGGGRGRTHVLLAIIVV